MSAVCGTRCSLLVSLPGHGLFSGPATIHAWHLKMKWHYTPQHGWVKAGSHQYICLKDALAGKRNTRHTTAKKTIKNFSNKRQVHKNGRRCHSSSGFSLSQFVLFLRVIPDRLMMIRSDLCVEHRLLSDSLCKQKSHWIITINDKMNVQKCYYLLTHYSKI